MDWVKAITFDFWGTLVDVDTSGAKGMRKVLSALQLSHLDPMQQYLAWDTATVKEYRATNWRPYLHFSALSLRKTLHPYLGPHLAEQADWAALTHLLVATMTSEAKPHRETPDVIALLKTRAPLMPITNMDTAYFRMNPFGKTFDAVTTAEEAQAFKPRERIFRFALERLNIAPENVLHVSLSQFADIEGVKPLGIKCAWINRGGERLGVFTPVPDYEFPDLRGVKRLFGG